MQRSFTNIRIAFNPRRPPIQRRAVHLSATLPAPSTVDSRLDTQSYADTDDILDRKLNGIRGILSTDGPDSSVIWERYIDFMSTLGHHSLPLEIHQQVLRRCAPHPSLLRPFAARRMRGPSRPRPPHVYEARLKTVMRNIRSLTTPSVDDYNYILEHFAAVGHLYGSMDVYNELRHVLKLQPNNRTFSLNLQTIAHRLTLPMYKNKRQRIQADCASFCKRLLDDMNSLNLPFTTIVLDLAMRISKSMADETMYSKLLKFIYGIDLDFPDHPPIQLDPSTPAEDGVPYLHPFSTAALNTTIDMIGRSGNVSKLVQAFEVLTQPLPPQASQHYSQEFDEEDDFGVVNPATTEPHRTPHAKPNSYTYNVLLKHLSNLDHSTLARHYLFEAYRLDRTEDRALRTQLYHTPYKTPVPQFSVNRNHLLSVLGLAKRSKDMELMRFVGHITRQTSRRKKNDIEYYTELRELQRRGQQPLAPDHDPSRPDSSESQIGDMVSSSSSQMVDSADPEAKPSSSPPRIKYFDISVHLDLLQKSSTDITAFYTEEYLPALTHKTQRLKERLERRVLDGKSIYLRSKGVRSVISRKSWEKMVDSQLDKTPEGENPAKNGDAGSPKPAFFNPSFRGR